MPDYNLAGLSTRSFEQLIGAIALKVFGVGLRIYGDGRDGGREATYEGHINYRPSNTANSSDSDWNGYLVIQAKFRQRPKNDKQQDGDWAIAELKKELQAFADAKKGRRRPDYYIFATNVTLSAVQKQGAKDKVYEMLKTFENQVPLKNYDVWDYDQIRSYLDNFEEIRKSYGAWLTSGDILAEMMKAIPFRRPDFETVIYNFLQKELLADEEAKLQQAGHANKNPISLASVFVDLPIASRERGQQDEKIIAKLLENAKDKLDPESLNFGDEQRMRDIAKHPQLGRWVIIGGPGQGKTTVGQFLCQLFRVAILKGRQKGLSREVRKALSIFDTQCKQDSISLPVIRRFPIRVVLNEFAANLASEKTSSLLDYITSRIRNKTKQSIEIEDLREWLNHYPWVMVLDGLDEVPASSNREQVLEAIRDFWVDAEEANADIMVVATTRPQGYNEDFSPDYYQHVWLAALTPEQALQYAERLIEVRYANDIDRQEKIRTRLAREVRDQSTTHLMRSPLQVTIMTALADQLGKLPKDRWKLFNEYYDIIYKREIERDILASEILRDYKLAINNIHKSVGLLLQVKSEGSGETDSHLSRNEFAHVVEKQLKEEDYEEQQCQNLSRQIIDAAANRLVFLVGLEDDVIGFEITSIREFMASEAIMNGNDELVRKRLDEIAKINHWKYVVLFAVGKCCEEREYLLDTIHTICNQLNEEDSLYHASLSGLQLALDILEDGAIRQRPKYLKSLTRLVLDLLDLPPNKFHLRLAEIYSFDVESIYKEEIEKRIYNPNYLQQLGAWSCLLALIDLGFDWARSLADKYWLTDENAQLEVIGSFIKIDQLRERINDDWLESKVINILPRISPLSIEEKIGWGEELIMNSSPYWSDLLERIFDVYKLICFSNWTDLIFQINEKEPKIFGVDYISIEGLTRVFEFENILNPSSHWLPYISIANFLNNPSKDTLADTLTTIAENYNFLSREWIEKCNFPWPIKECLQVAKTSEELRAIAEKAKAGKLGDYLEWQDAEQRWSTLALSEQDLLYIPDEGLPFDHNIARVGFPFASSSLSFNSHNFSSSFLPDLLKIYSEYKKLLLGEIIAYYIIYFLNRIELNININLLDFEIFKDIIIKTSEQFSWEKIEFIYNFPGDNEQKIELIDLIGRKFVFMTGDEAKSFTSLLNNLISEFSRNPNLSGILRILSILWIDSKERRELLSKIDLNLLKPENFDEFKYKEAAIIVSLARQEWSEGDIDEVVKYAIDWLDDCPRIITRILYMIERDQFTASVSEQFLEKLYSKIPKSQWQTLNQILEVTNKLLSKRKSSLGDIRIWSQLNLPKIIDDDLG